MRYLHAFFLLGFVLLFTNAQAAITGSMSAPQTVVCSGTSDAHISFQAEGGEAPYTFTYTIDGAEYSVTSDNDGKATKEAIVGTHTYVLTKIADKNNDEISVAQSATVTVNQSPDATLMCSEFNANTLEACGSEEEFVFFHMSSTSDINTQYSIDWGDGAVVSNSFSIGNYDSHRYKAGTYNLSYTVYSAECQSTQNYPISLVSIPAVKVEKPSNTDICIGTEIEFPLEIPANTEGTTYTISFGDGNSAVLTGSQKSIKHSYTNPSCGLSSPGGYSNSYTFTITAQNRCGSATGTVAPIYVSSAPEAKIAAKDEKLCVNTATTLTNVSVGGSAVTVDQSGGTTCVENTKPVWKITPNTYTGVTAIQLGMDGGSTNPKNWVTGSNVITPTFTKPGIYTITMKVGSKCGISEDVVTICVEELNTPTFNLSAATGCLPLTVAIDNTTDVSGSVCTPTTYDWKVNYTTSNCGTGSGFSYVNDSNKNSREPSFLFNNPGTYNISVTTKNTCKAKTSLVQSVVVKDKPKVTINSIAAVCQTFPTTTIKPTAKQDNCGSDPLTYSWTFDGATPATSTAIAPSVTYPDYGVKPIKLTVSNECGTSVEATANATIKQSPVMDPVENQTVCANANTTAINFSTTPSPSSYAWTNTNTAIGKAASGTGSVTPFKATNTTTAPIKGTFTVTPTLTATGCVGEKQSFDIIVNPLPVVNLSKPAETICSESSTTGTTLSSTTTGAIFKWEVTTLPAGVSGVTALSGTGNTIPAQTITNTTNTAKSIIYTVKAYYPDENGCEGAAKTYTIIVNPKPGINDKALTPICSGDNFSFNPNSEIGNVIPAGTTYSWGTPTISGGLTGGATGTNQAAISGTLTNTTNIAQTATYTVTPKTTTCTGTAFKVQVTVNPKPKVTGVNKTICNGDKFDATPVNGSGNIVPAGTTYTWTVSANANITGQANQATPVAEIAQTLTNATNSDQTITYTVTPTSGDCVGANFTFQVTVKPSPSGAISGDASVCLNAANPKITFTGSYGTAPYTFYYKINDGSELTATTASNSNTVTVSVPTSAVGTFTYTLIRVKDKSANTCENELTGQSATVNVTAKPVVNLIDNQEYCAGDIVPLQAITSTGSASTTFAWSNNNTAIGLSATGNNSVPSFTASNTSPNAISGIITIVPTENGCVGDSKSYTIKVNPLPVVTFSPATQTVCSGAATSLVTLQSLTAGTTFGWTAEQPEGITGVETAGTSTIPVQTLINSTDAPITVIYKAKGKFSTLSCEGQEYEYRITVNPKASIAKQTAEICSGESFTITPSSSENRIPLGTTYNWIPVSVTGISGAVAGSGASITGTLTNTTNSLQTAIYTVTPISGACAGEIFQVEVSVKPKATITVPAQTICSGALFNVIPANGINGIVPAGTTYTWTVSGSASITGATAVSSPQTAIGQELRNISSTQQSVTYTVTPTSDGCVGNPFTITVNVKPYPTGIISGSTDICWKAAPAEITFTGAQGSAPYIFYYTINDGAEISVTSAANGIATVYAPSLDLGTFVYKLQRVVSNDACSWTEITDQSATVNVNEMAILDPVLDKTICNGEQTPLIEFTSTGQGASSATYSWTNTNAAIGLASSGTGDINPFTAANTTAFPIEAIISVTPSLGACVGTPASFKITVNPSPIVSFNRGDETICSNSASTEVSLHSATTGATFSWTAVQPAGISGAILSGTNTIDPQTLINSTTLPITVTYTAVASYSSLNCVGASKDYKIIVDPTPVVADETAVTCSGSLFTVTPQNAVNGNIIAAGTTYTWVPKTIPAGITGAVSGSGASITGTLNNTTNTVQTAIYTVTPKTDTCEGASFEVEVIVNPKPSINKITETICSGSAFSVTPTNGINGIVPANTTYIWTVAANPNVTGYSNQSAAQEIITQSLTNNSIVNQTVTYTVTPTSGEEGNCVGVTFVIEVIVLPAPSGTISGNADLCLNAAKPTITFTGVNGSAPYTFYYTIDGGSEQEVSSAGSSSTITILADTDVLGTHNYQLVKVKDSSTNTCEQNISGQSVDVIVNAIPTVTTITPKEYCANTPSDEITLSSPTAGSISFTWVNSNPAIGLAASGSGNSIAPFTTTNTTDNPISGTITVTPKLGGCTGTPSNFTITIDPLPTVNFSIANQTICSNGQTAEVTLTSPTAGATFSWTAVQPVGITGVTPSGMNSISPQTLINTTTSPITVTYTAIASSALLSCEGVSKDYKIIVNPTPVIADEEISTCSGSSFIVSPQNGDNGNVIAAGTTYSWSAPVVTGGMTGGVSNSGQGNISGTLTNPTNTPQTATYTVTPKTGTCEGATFEVEVTVNPKPSINKIIQTICSGTAFSVTPQDGTHGIVPVNTTYTWTVAANPNVTGYSNQNAPQSVITQSLTNNSISNQTVTYTVTPTSGDAGNCVGTAFEVEVTVLPAPSGTITGTTTVCQNSTAPTITFNGLNGTAPYTFYYTIDGGVEQSVASTGNVATITANTSVVGAHTYALIRVKDNSSNTCEELITAQETIITVVTPPSISQQPLSTQAICTNGQIAALSVAYQDGVGTPSYQWYKNTTNSNAGGTMIAGANLSSYTPPASDFPSVGKYYYYAVITLTGGGCGDITSDPAEVDVASIPPTVVAPLAEQTICQNTTPTDLQVIAGGGIGSAYSYQWYDEAGAIAGATSDTYTPSTAVVGIKNYYCEVSQSSIGCTSISAGAKVEVTKGPSLTTQPVSSEICEGETATLLQVAYEDGTGAVSYQWYENTTNQYNGTPIAGAITATFAPPVDAVKTTYYYCIVTFAEGGCGVLQSDIAQVKVKQVPVINNKSFLIGSEIPLSYTPQDGIDGNVVPAGTTYTWTIASITPVGGVSGATAQSSPQPSFTQTLTNVTEQTVVVTYTVTPQANGCPGAPFTIEMKLAPSIKVEEQIKHITCYNENDGEIEAVITGGLPPYNITWTGPNGFTATTAKITNLKKGYYTLQIGDDGGLPFTKTFEVKEPDEFILVIADSRQIFCNATTDAFIDIDITGGNIPYTFAWTKDGVPFAITEDLTNIGKGIYVVTVDDENHCGPLTKTLEIKEPAAIEITLDNQVDVLCYNAATGSLSITATGGTITPGGDYTYSWTGPNGFTSNQRNIQNLKAGTYTVTITDESTAVPSCSKTATYEILQPGKVEFTITKQGVSCYDGDDGWIEVVVTGGVAPYIGAWDNFASGFKLTDLTVGDYTITVADANACVKTETINIPQAAIFRVTPVVKQISCYGKDDGSIKLNYEGGQAPIQFGWEDNPTAGVERNRLSPGNYTVHIKDSKGCKIDRSFMIIEPAALQLAAQITNAMDCNNPNTGAIDLQITGGTLPYAINWSNGATTEDLIDTPPNNYFVNVTDDRGCTITGQYTVQRPTPIDIQLDIQQLFNCSSNHATQQTKAIIVGGVAPYQIDWSAGQVSGTYGEIMQTSQNGAVTVTVMDAVGCYASKMFETEIPEYGIKATLVNCNERMYMFDAVLYNAHPGDTYTWSFDDGTTATGKTQPHQFSRAGTYTVSLHVNSSTCNYTFTKSIFVEPIPSLSISPEAKLCPGESTIITAHGADFYQWIDGSTNDSFTVNTLGTYTVRGTTKNGCFSDATVEASYYPTVGYKIQASPTAIMKQFPTIDLFTQEIAGSNFVWDFGDNTTAGGNYIAHTYDIIEDRVYEVKLYATNPYGCLETDSINIHANKSMEVMPNTFTPNGDGIHDRFMEGWKIEVYNRNGVLLYEGSDGWDGTYKGKPVGSDTYFYVVYDKTEDGMKKKSNYVTIIR
jgi:gliding motility-associated-like protein